MRLFDIGNVSFQNCFRHKGRTIINSLIIALGILVFILTNSLSSGIHEVAQKEILQAMPMREINVLMNHNSAKAQQLNNKQLEKFKKIPHVILVYPQLDIGVGVLENSKKMGATNVRGLPKTVLPTLTKGNSYDDKDQNVVIIPSNLSLAEGKFNGKDYIGRNLQLEYPSMQTSGQQIMQKYNVKVIGVYDSSKRDLPPNTFFVPLAVAIQMKAAANGLSLENFKEVTFFEKVTLLIDEDKNVQNVAEKIEKMGFSTSYLAKELSTMPGALRILIIIGGSISIIVLVSGAISIGATMMQATKNRVREIGLMKAVGFLSRDVFNIFLTEAMFIGLLGGIIGIVVSFIIIQIMQKVLSSVNILPYFPIRISGLTIVVSLIICLGISFIGSLIPTVRASKISPSEALRSE